MKNIRDCMKDSTPAQTAEMDEGDYIKDSFIYCGKCHTPRQMKVMLFDKECTVFKMCKCRAERSDRERAEFERQQRLDKIERMRRAGITDKRYLQMRFDKSDAALTFAKNYVDNWQRFRQDNVGLMILGGTGVGKTFAAACIANALLDKCVSVYMANIMSVCDKLGSFFNAGRAQFIDSLRNFSLLVLDDLGAERQTDFVQEQIYNIIEARYRSGLPLIITSNITPEQLRECDSIKYARTYDRLKEMCHPVVIEGESRRRRLANKRFSAVQSLLYDNKDEPGGLNNPNKPDDTGRAAGD